jgi:hypothetical protein
MLADQQKYLFGFQHEMILIFEVSIGAVNIEEKIDFYFKVGDYSIEDKG